MHSITCINAALLPEIHEILHEQITVHNMEPHPIFFVYSACIYVCNYSVCTHFIEILPGASAVIAVPRDPLLDLVRRPQLVWNLHRCKECLQQNTTGNIEITKTGPQKDAFFLTSIAGKIISEKRQFRKQQCIQSLNYIHCFFLFCF